MSIEAWAFLVSRNPYIDYRTIVAPDFICAAGIPNLLARAADGELTEIGNAIYRRIEGSDVEDFTIIFRVIEAKGDYINSTEGNNILKDSFGREIYLIEGLVVKGTDKVSITNEDLEKAHEQVKASYQKFWEYTDIPMVESSSCFSLKNVESIKDSDLLNIEEIQPLKVNSKKKAVQNSSWVVERKLNFSFAVSSIAFSPSEHKIAVRGYNPFLEMWDFNNNRQISSVDKRLMAVPYFDHDKAIIFSPDGKLIVFSSIEGADCNNILLWNVETLQESIFFRINPFNPFLGSSSRIHSFAFSNNGNVLASASKDGIVNMWNISTKEQYPSLMHHNSVYTIAFTPTDFVFASGDSKGYLQLWDIKSHISIDRFKSKQLSSINSIAFSSDSLMLAVGGNSSWVDAKDPKYLEIWDMKTKDVIYVLDGHKDQVNSVAFSPNGQVLASGSNDGSVKLWDVNSGKEISTLYSQDNKDLTSEITSVAFSPDGLLASGSMGGHVTIWRS